MIFSERLGFVRAREAFQLRKIDNNLKIGLWNVLYLTYFENLPFYSKAIEKDILTSLRFIWFNFFKYALDAFPENSKDIMSEFKDWFFSCKWFEIYDLFEFIKQELELNISVNLSEVVNHVLEQEKSGYRFVNGYITPITNETEIEEIEDSLSKSSNTILQAVNEHLTLALTKLTDRENPDYRNSIKESISAVESLCRIILDNPKPTLGKALDVIEKKVGLHSALKKGYSAIYGYTSEASGIRHSLTDKSVTPEFEDAKYMLVSCSAFVNYLIAKAEKIGVKVS